MPALRLFNPSHDADEETSRPVVAVVPPLRPNGVLTGGDIIRSYLADLEARRQSGDVTDDHFTNYRRSLQPARRDERGEARYCGFAEIIGDIPARDLIQHNLSEWVAKNPQWKSAESRRNNTAAVIACFNWADEEGLLKPTPYKRSRRLKEARVTRRDATDAELAKVWQTASPALQRVLWLIDRTGLRTCEARLLEFDKHILWDQSIIKFDEHKTLRQLKLKEPKIVGLDRETLAELQRWRVECGEGQRLVCLSQRRRPWTKNNLDKAFRLAREKAGLAKDLKAYCFRHRYVTQSRLAGASREEVGQQAGHKSPTMTDHYTHLEDKPEHQAAKAAAAAANAEKIAGVRAARTKTKLSGERLPLFDGLD